LKGLDGLVKCLSCIFSLIAFLLVVIITIANGLSLFVIIKRGLLATLSFGIFGWLLGLLLIKLARNDDVKDKLNSVSEEQAAQQYANQNQNINQSQINNKEMNEEIEDEFQPLDLEEVDYDKLDELDSSEELSDQDPEKLAEVVKSLKGS
jgi:hypothetical protein